MYPNSVTPEPQCEECTLKDEVIEHKEKLLEKKDGDIVEKTATIAGMSQKVKTMTGEKTDMQKKLKETDTLKKTLTEKNKEISNLKAEVKTKDGLLALAKERTVNIQPEVRQVNNEVVLEAEVKRCKRCRFTAPNLQVLALHIENDHQLEFDCNECGNKFPFKNQLKIHRREVHEEGSFSCFVCNAKFRTHKDLKQHIQKRCKSDSNLAPKTVVHKHNEDILKEDEHRCPKCPKITNNQVSLVHHINTMHMVETEKCDTCGHDFENREVLIKHIVDNHTDANTEKCDTCGHVFENREVLIKHIVDIHTKAKTTIIPRFICKVCNVEVHGDLNMNSHMCRKPQWGCDWCKQEFYSSEARKNHICEKHRFKTVDEQLRARKRSQTECTNGTSCFRAARNRCWFKHSQPINVIPQQGQGVQVQQGQRQEHVSQEHGQNGQEQHSQGHHGQGQHGQGQWRQGQRRQGQRRQGHQGQGQGHQVQGQASSARPQLYCRFQERCFKGEACEFKHFQVGFHVTDQPQNQQ